MICIVFLSLWREHSETGDISTRFRSFTSVPMALQPTSTCYVYTQCFSVSVAPLHKSCRTKDAQLCPQNKRRAKKYVCVYD